MDLQTAAIWIGVISGLIGIGAAVWWIVKKSWGRIKPYWENWLLSRGRVRCPKCSKVFRPKFQTDTVFGQEFTVCPRCKESIAKEYVDGTMDEVARDLENEKPPPHESAPSDLLKEGLLSLRQMLLLEEQANTIGAQQGI